MISSKRGLQLGFSFVGGLSLGALVSVVILSIVSLQKPESINVQPTDRHLSSSQITDSTSATKAAGIGPFKEIFGHRNIADQSHALHSVLAHATQQELTELWHQAKNIARENHRKITQHAILQNLTATNPQEALRIVEGGSKFQTNDLLHSVFSQWSVTQLDAAITVASTFEAPQRKIALQAILEIRDDLSESKRRSIAVQLGDDEHYLKLVSDSRASQNLAEPKKSWDILVNDEVDNSLQQESLTIVAAAWFEQDGFEVLSKIFTQFQDNTSVSEVIRQRLVRVLVKMDPAGALNYTRALPQGLELSYLTDEIVGVWARTDPKAALVAIAEFKQASLISELEKQIASVWARTNPYDLITNIEAISEQFRISPLETAFLNIAQKNPLEAITLLSSVESYVGNTSTITKEIVLEWSLTEPNAAAEWIVDNFSSEDPHRQNLLEDILPILAAQDPNRAFDLAIEQRTSADGNGLELQVIRVIARDGDIELAKKLLPRVKENTQVSAFSAVGSELVRASRTDEALELGKDFTGTKERKYFESIMYFWTDVDAKDLYESIANLPSSKIKSIAARAVIIRHQIDPFFNDDQIEYARSFLNTDDAAIVKRFENR